MSARFTCDWCGKTSMAEHDARGFAVRPWEWWSRVPKMGQEIHACSRECLVKINENTADGGPEALS